MALRDGQIFRIPVGAMAPDQPSVGPKIQAAKNLVPASGGRYREMPSGSFLGDFVSITNVGDPVGEVLFSSAEQYYFGTNGSSARLFQYNPNATTLSDVSRAANYSAATGWRFTEFGSTVIATNGVDAVQGKASGAALFSDLITSATKPKGNFLGTIRSHVVMSSITEGGTFYPRRVWWSAKDNAADWDVGSDRSGWFEVPANLGVIVDMVCFEHFGLLFMTLGIVRFDYIGGDVVFSRQQIAGPEFAPDSGASYKVAVRGPGNSAIFHIRSGRLGVVMDGQAVQEIGEGLWKEYFGANVSGLHYAFFDDLVVLQGAPWTNSPADEDGLGGSLIFVAPDGTAAMGSIFPFDGGLISSPTINAPSPYLTPLVELHVFRTDGNDVAAYKTSWSSGVGEAQILTGIVEPLQDRKAGVRAVRMVHRKYAEDGESQTTTLEYKLEWSNDPGFASPLNSGWLPESTSEDDAGWVHFPDMGPGQFWRVWVKLNAVLGRAYILRELSTIDLLVIPSQEF